MKAFLGMGLLGSNFVRALLKQGNEVHVWNRTESKSKALEVNGARSYATPEEAVKGADSIHLTLSDDQAVEEILEKARPGFSPGVMLIDHTTTTAEGAIKRSKKWKELGYSYIHAPVFMGPQNALNSTGYMLVSGDKKLIDRVEPELAKMTGKLVYLGPLPGRAAGIKLLGNLFLITLTSGISDTLALAKALEIPASDVGSLFEWFNPGAMAPARLNNIIKDNFDSPSWELKMARKDVRLMMEEAQRGNAALAVIPAIAREMDRWIEKGMQDKDWTVIAKDNLRK